MTISVPLSLDRPGRDRNPAAILAAWRVFISVGDVDNNLVRAEVTESWRRSRALGVDPFATTSPAKLSDKALGFVHRANADLIEVALPFMRFLEAAVRDSGFILALTDARGTVLEAFGDEAILALANENNYGPGSCRTEAEVGTNAIGLVLVLRKPVQLTGAEHFSVRHHGWGCASAPVFAPDGHLLGTVTLSGESPMVHCHTLGMVISAAEAIQERLRERQADRQRRRADSLIDSILGSISEAIIALDGDGIITNINPRAAHMLAVRPRAVLGRGIDTVFARSSGIMEVLGSTREALPLEVVVDGGRRQSHFVATPYLMQGDGGIHGAILALSERRGFLANIRDISGLNATFTFNDIVGQSPALLRQIQLAKIAARQDARILITGETGTGKELFAQSIHNASRRWNGPFVAVNCAAIPRELLESELFGYREGAFTGTRKGGQVGKLELADGGSLFLDEIGQMPLDLQAKLLRVLEDGMVTRLGDSKPIKVDIRLLSATNDDLLERIEEGGFRRDLYYRLCVVEVRIPPLRERHGDIRRLTDRILSRLNSTLGNGEIAISREAVTLLDEARWPGNVRELENVLEMAAIVCEGGVIEGHHVSHRLDVDRGHRRTGRIPAVMIGQPIKDVEADILRATMKEFHGNIALVSRKLGVSRSTIYRRMKDTLIVRSVCVE